VNSTVTPYATVNHYAPHGAVRQMTLGNNVVETTKFDYNGSSELNTRLQPSQIAVGSLLTLNYYYCSSSGVSCSTNYANVQSQKITRGSNIWTDAYGYLPMIESSEK